MAELFANVSGPARLVLDGLDKCFEEAAFDEAAELLRCASATENRDRWQTAVTCCPEDWERVRAQLIRRSVMLPDDAIRVGRFTDAELRSVCEQVPSLPALAHRPHLSAILHWPKALDIVATYWKATDASVPWVTESDFARWFWRSGICKDELGSYRDRVARKLAVDLADRMAPSAPLDNFTPNEAEILVQLAREGHVDLDPLRRTVRFTHELIGDWARQRELQVHGEADATFLRTRLHSPLWHRAVRFHGLELLESHADAGAWQRLFLSFQGDSPSDEMARNLLLKHRFSPPNRQQCWSDSGRFCKQTKASCCAVFYGSSCASEQSRTKKWWHTSAHADPNCRWRLPRSIGCHGFRTGEES